MPSPLQANVREALLGATFQRLRDGGRKRRTHAAARAAGGGSADGVEAVSSGAALCERGAERRTSARASDDDGDDDADALTPLPHHRQLSRLTGGDERGGVGDAGSPCSAVPLSRDASGNASSPPREGNTLVRVISCPVLRGHARNSSAATTPVDTVATRARGGGGDGDDGRDAADGAAMSPPTRSTVHEDNDGARGPLTATSPPAVVPPISPDGSSPEGARASRRARSTRTNQEVIALFF